MATNDLDLNRSLAELELALPPFRRAAAYHRANNQLDQAESALRKVIEIEDGIQLIGKRRDLEKQELQNKKAMLSILQPQPQPAATSPTALTSQEKFEVSGLDRSLEHLTINNLSRTKSIGIEYLDECLTGFEEALPHFVERLRSTRPTTTWRRPKVISVTLRNSRRA